MVVIRPAGRGRILSASQSTAPVFRNHWLSANTQAIVITAGWLKPASASPDGTNPVMTQAMSAVSAHHVMAKPPHYGNENGDDQDLRVGQGSGFGAGFVIKTGSAPGR